LRSHRRWRCWRLRDLRTEVDPRVPVLMSGRLRGGFQEARDWRKDRKRRGIMWGGVLRQEWHSSGRSSARASSWRAPISDRWGLSWPATAISAARAARIRGFSPKSRLRSRRRTARDSSRIPVSEELLKACRPTSSSCTATVTHISDVRKVELVFKDGVAYDPDSPGGVGRRHARRVHARRLLTLPVIIVNHRLACWLHGCHKFLPAPAGPRCRRIVPRLVAIGPADVGSGVVLLANFRRRHRV